MRTSGVVLDVYDDVGGEVLRAMFPTQGHLPGFVKQAHALTSEERGQLPDDAFALVLLNGEEKLRKFACIDEGNTALSVLYFLKNAHKLPLEARTTAAGNLKVACGWYGLDVPVELEKEAGLLGSLAREGKGALGAAAGVGRAGLGAVAAPFKAVAGTAGFLRNPIKSLTDNPLGTAMTALSVPSLVKGTAQNIKQNLAKVRAGEAQGGVRGGLAAMSGPEGYAHFMHEANKVAEVTGTVTMPLSAAPGKKPEPSETTIRKSAHLRPVVDVRDKEPVKEATVKTASRYALGAMYPLDSYEQVKLAAQYFDEYARRFDPADRHEYCVNLVKRASELDIPLSPLIRKYGSESYGPEVERTAALEARRSLVEHTDKEASAFLDDLSASHEALPPEDYATVLAEFDKRAGIDHLYGDAVMDPYYSTFGFEKNAEDEKKEFTDVIGNFYVTGEDLNRLRSNKPGLQSTFGDDFCEEFCKDPVGIYKSMPVDQKKLLIRMATENSPV